MKLFFKKYGDGKPLIILHGLLGAGGNWHTLASRVFSRSATVYAVDLRNHGQSPHDPRMDYESMAGDVSEFIEDHSLVAADVMGHSMGGKVAMQLALTNPDVLDRLIIVDVAPRRYEDRHAYIIEALKSLDVSRYTSRSQIDSALAKKIPSDAVRQFLLKNLRYSPDAGYTWIMNLEAIEDSYDDIAGPVTASGVFDHPSLFVRGGGSDYLLDSDEPDIRRSFSRASFVTIGQAGHWVHAEAPEAFADAVSTFLSNQ